MPCATPVNSWNLPVPFRKPTSLRVTWAALLLHRCCGRRNIVASNDHHAVVGRFGEATVLLDLCGEARFI
jgi:hypothetical protein